MFENFSENFFVKKSKIIPNIFSVNKTKLIDPRKWKLNEN